MTYEEDNAIDYDAEVYDTSEQIELEENDGVIGKYDFLMRDDIEKERESKIEEFIQFSSLQKNEAELILIHYNWNIEILMNDWFDKIEKIKENSGLSQTKQSKKKIKEFFLKIKLLQEYV